MNIRKLHFPQGFDIVGKVIMSSFQYPDNPEWGLQAEEKQQVFDALVMFKRFWPFLSVLRLIFPGFRAYALYDKLGFEHFSDSIYLNYKKDELPEQVALPVGFETVSLKPNDQGAAYQLNQRIFPKYVKKYKSVMKTTFRGEAFLMRILEPLLGVRSGKMAIRSVETGEIVAYSSSQYRTGRAALTISRCVSILHIRVYQAI